MSVRARVRVWARVELFDLLYNRFECCATAARDVQEHQLIVFPTILLGPGRFWMVLTPPCWLQGRETLLCRGVLPGSTQSSF